MDNVRTAPQAVSNALRWIVRAHNACRRTGVAAAYALYRGWRPPYPETTGYIIPTLLACAKVWPEEQRELDLLGRALEMGNWLSSIQLPSGAFSAGVWHGKPGKPSVFNSGQILFGLIALWKETGEEFWRDRGIRCAHWLARVQAEDGTWRRYNYRNVYSNYSCRVAWAMALAGKHWDAPKLMVAAERNLQSVLRWQTDNGWIDRCGFSAKRPPSLHTFAYTVRGLLEGGRLLGNRDVVNAAGLAAEALERVQLEDGSLPGEIRPDFTGPSYACLTGIAQSAVIWGRLADNALGGMATAARDRAIAYLEHRQVKFPYGPLQGGFAGSHPVWGRYMILRYPNWGPKFFVDAKLSQCGAMTGESWG